MGWKAPALTALIGYWMLCRLLRYRRLNHLQSRFRGRDPYSLSIDEAQGIVQEIFQLEMCYLSRFSTAFALFQTYGINSIAKILLKYAPPAAYPHGPSLDLHSALSFDI